MYILLADPHVGWRKIENSDAEMYWEDQLEVLLIKRLSDTPKKHSDGIGLVLLSKIQMVTCTGIASFTVYTDFSISQPSVNSTNNR